MLAHEERATALENAACVLVETEKSVVSESSLTLDHAGETARGAKCFG